MRNRGRSDASSSNACLLIVMSCDTFTAESFGSPDKACDLMEDNPARAFLEAVVGESLHCFHGR